jgi:hypothetical protein
MAAKVAFRKRSSAPATWPAIVGGAREAHVTIATIDGMPVGTAFEIHAACFRLASRQEAWALATLHRRRLVALGADGSFLPRIAAPAIHIALAPRLAAVLAFADLFAAGDEARILAAASDLAALGLTVAELAALTRGLAQVAFAARFPAVSEIMER